MGGPSLGPYGLKLGPIMAIWGAYGREPLLDIRAAIVYWVLCRMRVYEFKESWSSDLHHGLVKHPVDVACMLLSASTAVACMWFFFSGSSGRKRPWALCALFIVVIAAMDPDNTPVSCTGASGSNIELTAAPQEGHEEAEATLTQNLAQSMDGDLEDDADEFVQLETASSASASTTYVAQNWSGEFQCHVCMEFVGRGGMVQAGSKGGPKWRCHGDNSAMSRLTLNAKTPEEKTALSASRKDWPRYVLTLLELKSSHSYGVSQKQEISILCEALVVRNSMTTRHRKVEMDEDGYISYQLWLREVEPEEQAKQLWLEDSKNPEVFRKDNCKEFGVVTMPTEFIHDIRIEWMRKMEKELAELTDLNDKAAAVQRLKAISSISTFHEMMNITAGGNFQEVENAHRANPRDAPKFDENTEIYDDAVVVGVSGSKLRRVGESAETANLRIRQEVGLEKNKLLVRATEVKDKLSKALTAYKRYVKSQATTALEADQQALLGTDEFEQKYETVSLQMLQSTQIQHTNYCCPPKPNRNTYSDQYRLNAGFYLS
jgi:hypothetical protein